jgi:uncharacterized membrane protein YczE
MQNISKGWFTTLLGLVIMCLDIAYVFGFIKLPSVLTKPWEVLLAFIFGLFLFLMPPSKIEQYFDYVIAEGKEFGKKWLNKLL